MVINMLHPHPKRRRPVRYLFLTAAAAAGLMASAAPGEAGIYRWTDGHGTIHYTQTPPPSGPYKVLDGPPPPAHSQAAPAPAGSAPNQPSPPQQQAEKTQSPQLTPEQRDKLCTASRDRLAHLERRPNVLLRTADGQVKRLSEQERQAEIAKTKTLVAKTCPK